MSGSFATRNVELIELIGEEHASVIADHIVRCEARNPGPAAGLGFHNAIETVFVEDAQPLVLDPAGYFVVYPEPRRRTLILEH